jgi:hypothetical protein
MTGDQILYNVHYGLGQDPTSTTNYVSSTEIAAFVSQGQDVLCRLRKALPCIYTQTLTSETASYSFPSSGYPVSDITAAAETTGLTAIELYDLQFMGDESSLVKTGPSLKKIQNAMSGQLFYVSNNEEPIFYWTIGSLYTLSPTPVFSGSNYLNIYFYAIPPVLTTLVSATLVLDTDWHQLLVVYATAKGKEKYQLYSQAQNLLAQFAATAGLSTEQAKSIGA